MAGVIIALIVIVVSAAISAGTIVLLLPLLRRYALARPNARSSHIEPTPQGGGIAVVAATLAVAACVFVGFRPTGSNMAAFGLLAAATLLIGMIGAADDFWTLGIAPRLALQALAAGLMLAALPSELRVAASLPWWLERALMLIAALWFINFTNFMDGIDWMMVAEVVPVTTGLALIALMGELPHQVAVVALALCGAILGFAPFNRPVAKLFLGDVGSLPVGLLLAWMLVTLAGQGHLVAALLLPFYFASDATITLARRIRAGERAWEAHRGHFYQRATAGGFTVREVVTRVFMVNAILVALAIVSVRFGSTAVQLGALAAGVALVGGLLWSFARGKP